MSTTHFFTFPSLFFDQLGHFSRNSGKTSKNPGKLNPVSFSSSSQNLDHFSRDSFRSSDSASPVSSSITCCAPNAFLYQGSSFRRAALAAISSHFASLCFVFSSSETSYLALNSLIILSLFSVSSISNFLSSSFCSLYQSGRGLLIASAKSLSKAEFCSTASPPPIVVDRDAATHF